MSKSRATLFFSLLLGSLGVTGQTLAGEQTSVAVQNLDTSVSPAARSTGSGAFLPLTLAPRVDSQRGMANFLAGYDGARGSMRVEAAAEVRIVGPLAVRVGVDYAGEGAEVRPSVGAQVQLFNQTKSGIDAALALFYKPEGFTEPEGELEVIASIGRQFGALTAFGNLVYGQDPEGHERDAELRAGALYRAGERLHAGLDARVRVNLSPESSEAAEEEPLLDLVAGPVATYAFGRAAVTCQAGISALRSEVISLGPIALCGVGAAF